ncbi:MAG: tagaturonate epimerase family protein, partial [Planctomycetota bacterium]
RAAPEEEIAGFVSRHEEWPSGRDIPGCEKVVEMSGERMERIARKYLLAVREAGRIYRHIAGRKGHGHFVTEVSMDETDRPQSPGELFIILVALADEGIPVQTVAPKFPGRFNKGVDYVGDVERFEDEFRAYLGVISLAVDSFDLPENLKLSVHSGSDKFCIYGPIHRALRHYDAGLHVKTAGTTWLEELIGLAEAGGKGLCVVRDIYAEARNRKDELCAPYAPVVDIDSENLPSSAAVERWDGHEFAAVMRHDSSSSLYNPNVRQLLHVAYKIAAEMGERYLEALDHHKALIARNVMENLYARHIEPLFMGDE